MEDLAAATHAVVLLAIVVCRRRPTGEGEGGEARLCFHVQSVEVVCVKWTEG